MDSRQCQRGAKKHGEEAFYDEGSPDFSEAPDLRSPASHLKTYFRKINCINRNNPMAQVYNYAIFLNKLVIPMNLG